MGDIKFDSIFACQITIEPVATDKQHKIINTIETAIMQRVFVVAYGEVTNISLERSRAISNLLNEYLDM